MGLLRFGEVDLDILEHLREGLISTFKNIFREIHIIDKIADIPENAYNSERGQYSASLILHAIRIYADAKVYDKILGITPLDLYVPQLNFVFGMAEFGIFAKAAVISLYRLYPEFFGQSPDRMLFLMRVIKEGVHEIGHTFGLEHCSNQCIMIFSNSIYDTDKKPATYCGDCWNKIQKNSKL